MSLMSLDGARLLLVRQRFAPEMRFFIVQMLKGFKKAVVNLPVSSDGVGLFNCVCWFHCGGAAPGMLAYG
ncbi:hypothetical protein [Tardiphaga robiniae]|uniref:Uncharacterized protein n=1 Tax=Tardiphaga robiniae TaxID=943830 RepID=A0A7G6TU96_9BRAD|nr:hypothetical protein [Tardiphaga robiniae]QND70328.1 hypothetical protein HB776_03050 [Tardiphaga robiniae]